MSHCKRVRDMKADIKRALRWARNKGWGRSGSPRVVTYEGPDGKKMTAYRWDHTTDTFVKEGPA
jgi:hypothetical protein